MVNRSRQLFDNNSAPNRSRSINSNGQLNYRVHRPYNDILKRLDHIPLREICDSPSLAGVVVRLHMVMLEDYSSSWCISRFLLNHLGSLAPTSHRLEGKLKVLISYVRLVSFLHGHFTSSSRDRLKAEVNRTGYVFETYFNIVYLEIWNLEKGDELYLKLEIMHKLRQEYLLAGHSITLIKENNQYFLLTTFQGNSLLRRPDTTPENIVDRVIEDLDSINDERMELNKFEPYFEAILNDVETWPRSVTAFQFLTLFLKRLENTQIDLRIKLMEGFICIASSKRFKLLHGLNTVERREILLTFSDSVSKGVEMVQTPPENTELHRLLRLKEICTRSCTLPRDIFKDVNFDINPPIRKITRTIVGSGYISKRISSKRIESHPITTSNSDNRIVQDENIPKTYQSSKTLNTEVDKTQDKRVDETHSLVQDYASVLDPHDLESRTHKCASFRNDFSNFRALGDISQILDASFDFLNSEDCIPHQKLMNSSAITRNAWASCSFSERMLQERLFYFYTKGLCKFKMEGGGPIRSRFIPTKMAGSHSSASSISTEKQCSGKKRKAVVNHESSQEFDFLSQFTLSNMDINTIEVMLPADFSSKDYVNNATADSYISQRLVDMYKKGKYRIVFLHCKDIYDLGFQDVS